MNTYVKNYNDLSLKTLESVNNLFDLIYILLEDNG